MNPKIVLLLAVIAGLLAAFMVQQHVKNIKGESVVVFRATASAREGEFIGANVEEIEIPAGLFPTLMKEAPTADLADYVANTELRQPVEEGDLLLYRHFDASTDQGVLPEIPPGMKAISIPVTQISSVSYFVQPGDVVDVMGTFTGAMLSAENQSNEAMADISTRPILQAVRVLAVGEQYRPGSRQIVEPYASVTLLVTMEEAAKVIFAQDFYAVRLTLVLRGEGDDQVQGDITRVGIQTLEFDQIGNAPVKKAGAQ